MTTFIQLVVSGLALGSVYTMVALGFVLIYKATEILNFAQGNLMLMGAYLALTILTQFHVNLFFGIVLAVIVAAVMGAGIHFVVMRPMLGKPLFSVVMVTLGLSILIQALVQLFYGTVDRVYPVQVPNQIFTVAGARFSQLELTIIVVVAVLVIAFALFFRFSKLGLLMRATAEDQEVAVMMGVSANLIFSISWAIAAGMATIGGVFMANLSQLNLGLGDIGLRAFPAVVVGGLESVPGALLGGVIIGVAESLGAGYINGSARDVIAFSILLLILLIRPYGLFGQRSIIRV
jgi:branched-chain amino acid transport system permease protein